MVWDKSRLHYFYAPGTLRAIAKSYPFIYEIGLFGMNEPFGIAEFKADFDLALSSIGRTKWVGVGSPDFRSYRHYGRRQRAVIADIMGIYDDELQAWGFYNVPQLKGQAYGLMAEYLNSFAKKEVK